MFKLEFETGNAAFDGDLAWMEINTILRAVADRAGDGQTSGTIRDSNGSRARYFHAHLCRIASRPED